jgi:hypothetical protein
MLTKPSAELTLFDTLSRLTFTRAAKLLGPKGNRLIATGGKFDIDLTAQVKFDRDMFRLTLDGAAVTLTLSPAARHRLEWHCDACEVPCEHAGAAFSLILEEKLALGLAGAPPARAPAESVSEEALVAQALAERAERARTEKMRLTSLDSQEIWTDYTLTNAASGKSYRVALRGWQPGQSYCSCPDFRKNTLGTCKHILHALEKVQRRFSDSQRNRPYRRRDISVHLSYSAGTGIAFPSSSVVTGNTVENFSVGIWALGNSNSVKTNQVSLAGGAIVISGNSNDIESNSLLNLTRDGGSGITFNCTGTGNTVIHNLMNDATVGIVNHSGNTISPNTYSNVAVEISPPC